MKFWCGNFEHWKSVWRTPNTTKWLFYWRNRNAWSYTGENAYHYNQSVQYDSYCMSYTIWLYIVMSNALQRSLKQLQLQLEQRKWLYFQFMFQSQFSNPLISKKILDRIRIILNQNPPPKIESRLWTLARMSFDSFVLSELG